MATTKLMTAQDLWDLPEEDGYRFELIYGELQRMPGGSAIHGRVGMRIGIAIGNHAYSHGLGDVFNSEVGYVLTEDPDTVLLPDISFVSSERLPSEDAQRRFLRFGPDLAVEVLSPSNTVREMARKTALYFGAGTQLVWIINPEARTVTVHAPGRAPIVLNDTEQLDGEQVLPGFRVAVSDLFRSAAG